jgi:Tfp pilus assembly protein FimT
VVVVIGILLSIVGNRFRGLGNDLENATRETASFLRLVRAEATTTTSAYRVVVESETALRTEWARGCTGVPDDEWSAERSKRLALRDGVTLVGANAAPGTVLLCFSPRGVGNQNPVLVLEDLRGDQRQVEALIGGGVIITDVGGTTPVEEPET